MLQAAEACRDVFSKFSFFIKDVASSPASLVAELRKLNDYLVTSPHKYLTRDGIDHLDCIMLPKLQHIRVASRELKGFEIPHEFVGLWRYFKTAYETDVFTQTCPSDQEIVAHWVDKPLCPQSSKERIIQAALDGSSTHSLSLPEGLVLWDVVPVNLYPWGGIVCYTLQIIWLHKCVRVLFLVGSLLSNASWDKC